MGRVRIMSEERVLDIAREIISDLNFHDSSMGISSVKEITIEVLEAIHERNKEIQIHSHSKHSFTFSLNNIYVQIEKSSKSKWECNQFINRKAV
jgi:molybdopterin-biosynthesis enzyme MoeA-like protein